MAGKVDSDSDIEAGMLSRQCKIRLIISDYMQKPFRVKSPCYWNLSKKKKAT